MAHKYFNLCASIAPKINAIINVKYRPCCFNFSIPILSFFISFICGSMAINTCMIMLPATNGPIPKWNIVTPPCSVTCLAPPSTSPMCANDGSSISFFATSAIGPADCVTLPTFDASNNLDWPMYPALNTVNIPVHATTLRTIALVNGFKRKRAAGWTFFFNPMLYHFSCSILSPYSFKLSGSIVDFSASNKFRNRSSSDTGAS
mmetsp:Transcript_3922/g.12067  ORF Transcript_3922/g.12067 Transcript_3922/m.12067 type:complete len:204 (-) Transcript_3922:403-1014(-)